MFVRETYPVEVTAMGGAALMIVLGLLPFKDAGSVLSNSAPWTIAFLFRRDVTSLWSTHEPQRAFSAAARGDHPGLSA